MEIHDGENMLNDTRIYYFILSEDMTNIGAFDEKKKMLIYEPFYKRKMSLPSKLKFCITSAMHLHEPKNNRITAEFRDPSGNVLDVLPLSELMLENNNDIEKIKSVDGGVSVATQQGIEVDTAGEYHFVVLLNDEVTLFTAPVIIENENGDSSDDDE
ncbi:hypothetical protein JOD82_005515 [Paenibacillus sp. 1182]|uniref:hypothetical protein n=1 Tax=unclassified Paenibacillus TaxID=185978 RepID=UPI001AE30C50|nr:hypothetical protein [Paenibacillus sp. 1182]MBP1312370.1 hypothetical protein [Paenibacillus sp. 1182]